MVKIIALWLGTLASLGGLIFNFWPKPEDLTVGFFIVLTLLIIFLIFLIYHDVSDHLCNRPHMYKTQDQINDYMFNWISRGGRVIIFTRDMTWGSEPRIQDLLFTKARRNELTIYMPHATDLSSRLEKAGAKTVHYQALNFAPTSRFTIINADRMDAHVAIGRHQNGKHVIEEFQSGEHPVFAVTQDLIEVVKRHAKG